jgi:hypothetical protein
MASRASAGVVNRESDDGHVRMPRLDFDRRIDPVGLRHIDIHDDHCRPQPFDELNGFSTG